MTAPHQEFPEATAPPDAAAPALVEHCFRHEYGRLVSVLTRMFGWRNFDLVEDMVQAALVEALQHWRLRGVPDNPFAWLRRVARNKMLDALRHEEVRQRLTADLAARSQPARHDASALDALLDESGIEDSQLRMMFACCHPSLAPESRLALTLKTLCGFGNAEIARGLLTKAENIKKRLTRAKAVLIERGIELEVPPADQLPDRLDSVQGVLYLLFNEGYSSSSPDAPIREELCEEAIRLCHLLLSSPACATPATEALLALMLFHVARLPGRLDPGGSLLLLQDQDRAKWDRTLIATATRTLAKSGRGSGISRYHLEAGIAMLHSHAGSFAETNWQALLWHYDLLLQLYPSPVYALNRAIVVAELLGPEAGLHALASIADQPQLQGYHLLDATLGELHRRAGRRDLARKLFTSARGKTSSPFEQELLDRKLALCRQPVE